MAKGAGKKKGKVTWSSGMSVVLAVAGSAVGFGNFLRFPGLAAQYGGGAFMIAYFAAFLLMGVALSWMEWAIGRRGGALGGHTTASIFALLAPGGARYWKYLGLVGVVAPLGIAMYYMNLEGWSLGYAYHTLVGDLNLAGAEQFGEFFGRFSGAGGHGAAYDGGSTVLLFILLALAANFMLIYRGVVRGIEWFCKWSMPVLLVLALAIMVRVLTLGTPDTAHPERCVGEGLGYMWNPDKVMLVANDADGTTRTINMVPAHYTPQQREQFIRNVQKANPGSSIRMQDISILQGLLNPDLWVAAAGQIFWTLSIGFGVVCCYSSYVDPRKDIAMSSLTANVTNEAVEVGLAGMIIIPAAVSFLGVAAAAGCSTFGLGFNVLPEVFAAMPLGQFFGGLFFGLLFLAAVTSSLSLIQPMISFLEEFWGLRRIQSLVIAIFMLTVGTLMVAWFTGDGMIALDTLDFWMGTISLYVMSAIYVVVFRRVIGPQAGVAELQRGSLLRMPDRLYRILICWTAPLILAAIFISWVFKNLVGTTCPQIQNLLDCKMGALLPLAWVLAITCFCILVIHTSRKFRKKLPLEQTNERIPFS